MSMFFGNEKQLFCIVLFWAYEVPPMNEHVFREQKATILYSTLLGLLSTPYERARFLGTKSNFFV